MSNSHVSHVLVALACVASVSVRLGSKERLRNGIFGVFTVQKMGRTRRKCRLWSHVFNHSHDWLACFPCLVVRLPRWLKRAHMNNNNNNNNNNNETLFKTHLIIQKHWPFKLHVARNAIRSHDAALVRSHMNGLKPFERTIEQTTETMPPSPKTITAAAITTNRFTSLRELLHYRYSRQG